jgi:hypothetical protein
VFGVRKGTITISYLTKLESDKARSVTDYLVPNRHANPAVSNKYIQTFILFSILYKELTSYNKKVEGFYFRPRRPRHRLQAKRSRGQNVEVLDDVVIRLNTILQTSELNRQICGPAWQDLRPMVYCSNKLGLQTSYIS